MDDRGETHWPDDVVECRLVRTDGTEWLVSELDVEGTDVRVTGRSRARPAETIEDESLDRGDMVEWVDADGEVLWRLRHLGRGGPEEARGAGDGRGSVRSGPASRPVAPTED